MAGEDKKNEGESGGITYDSPYYLHLSDYLKQLHENRTPHESAAFKAFQRRNGPPGLNKKRSRAKVVEEGNKQCTECNKDGHTHEGCLKLNGYQEWWPGKKEEKTKGKAACVKTETGLIHRLRYEKYQLFMKYFSGLANRKSSKPTTNMAHNENVEAAITNNDEPKSFKQAAQDARWREAMQKEVKALKKNGTWALEYLPEGKRAIDLKWVYKFKFKPNGEVERYKARLVSKGFTQMEGVDYHDTFAPVAKLVTVRTLLAIAVKRDWIIHQFDENNAFLHGDLYEEVYMKISQGFSNDNETHKSTFETPVDFEEEILDAEVQANEAIPLTDEEIALDAASSEGSMSGPGSGGEEADVEANYGYNVYYDDY
nr:putative reverse transcriptase, RNA-dependent DNA polymerase [Tanacetum cinerariifolium]